MTNHFTNQNNQLRNLWSLQEINSALKTQLVANLPTESVLIKDVVIDSRKAEQNSLFIALKGENTDGHLYLNDVFNNGASYAIVSSIPDNLKSQFKQKLIIVEDTFKSLHLLADFARKRFNGKVIALTGSVGKTTTKEILGKVFSRNGKTFFNYGNLNNHIGLPLSLSNLYFDVDFAIFEIGMNHPNEITPLTKLARPHIAIVTNVGPTHIEFFKNEQEIARAKSEIFLGLQKNGYVLLNIDNSHYEFLLQQAKSCGVKNDNIISFGTHKDADYRLIKLNHDHTKNIIEIEASSKNHNIIKYSISSSNKAYALNSIIAFACLDLNKIEPNKGLDCLKDIVTEKGRGQVNQTIFNNKKITIIDDTYNASMLSMKIGIENCLDYQKFLKPTRTIFALGDMRELGHKSQEIHIELLEFIVSKKFDLLILVGLEMQNANLKVAVPNSINFLDSSSAQSYLESQIKDGDLIYIKGSRGIKMEKLFDNIINKNSAK